MYEGEYDKAIFDFQTALRTKKQAKQENENSDSDSDMSNQTDLSDVGLCSLNVNEHLFNIALCKLLMKMYPEALSDINQMVETSPKKYSKYLFIL